MADAVTLMTYLLVFVTGFIAGKLFAAIQFAGMKSAAKMAKTGSKARKTVDRLIRLGGKV